MGHAYRKAMDGLYLVCVIIAGSSQATRTSRTYDPGGPSSHQRSMSSTRERGPSKMASTRPEPEVQKTWRGRCGPRQAPPLSAN